MALERFRNTFPMFDDGDVEIRLTLDGSETYTLHSLVLSLHSSFFRASLSDQWTGSDTSEFGGKQVKYVYGLQFEAGQEDGILVRQSEHEPTNEQSAVMLSSHNETNTSLGQESSILAHKQLLRALYHVPFDLPKDPSDSVERTLKDLVAITDMYECRSVVDLSIQTHLLHFKTNETFLARCVRNPAEMLDFAILTRCNWMFVEVFVHLLSNDSLWDHHQTIIRKHGLERLFERKIASYQSLVKDVVLRIVSTVGVCHDTESYEVNIGRMFFQQQLAALLQNRFTDSPVLVIEALVNKKLLQFEYGWLASLETFTNRFAKGRIAESKKAYKDCLAEASVIASELLVNPCKVDTKFLDGACSPITRLLCFTITEDELPWNQKLS